MEAFYLEAGIVAAGQGATMVEAGIARGGLHIWEDDGPTSFVGITTSWGDRSGRTSLLPLAAAAAMRAAPWPP